MPIITGEVTYMPPKAEATCLSMGNTKPSAVSKPKRHTVNMVNPLGAGRELNVSNKKTNKMRTSNPIS